jgi:hypothetical protein
MIYLYSANIDDPEMDNQIMKVIDENCECKRNTTNVKAGMTDWYMQEYPGFVKLAKEMEKISARASFTRYQHLLVPEVNTMWGARYSSGEYTIEHRHYPSLWSCVYYPNTVNNAPPITFIDEYNNNEENNIDVDKGLLLCFESTVKHKVDPRNFEGYRYVVASNINHNWANN